MGKCDHIGFDVAIVVGSDALHFCASSTKEDTPTWLSYVSGSISADGIWHVDNGNLFGRSRDDMRRLAALVDMMFGEARRRIPNNTIPPSESEAAEERLLALIESLKSQPASEAADIDVGDYYCPDENEEEPFDDIRARAEEALSSASEFLKSRFRWAGLDDAQVDKAMAPVRDILAKLGAVR